MILQFVGQYCKITCKCKVDSIPQVEALIIRFVLHTYAFHNLGGSISGSYCTYSHAYHHIATSAM